MTELLWKTISYVLCEFNSVVRWNKGKTTFLVRLSFQIYKHQILVSYSTLAYVNVNMCVLIVILKLTLVLMCLASHFDTMEGWKVIVEQCEIYYAKKILNYFLSVEVWNRVEKWNICESHIIPRSLVQTFSLDTTSLCFNTRLRVKKYFQILYIFNEVKVTVWLLCAHPEWQV